MDSSSTDVTDASDGTTAAKYLAAGQLSTGLESSAAVQRMQLDVANAGHTVYLRGYGMCDPCAGQQRRDAERSASSAIACKGRRAHGRASLPRLRSRLPPGHGSVQAHTDRYAGYAGYDMYRFFFGQLAKQPGSRHKMRSSKGQRSRVHRTVQPGCSLSALASTIRSRRCSVFAP